MASARFAASEVEDVRQQINALRQIKSPAACFLQKAIDLSLDAHLEAMKMMRRACTISVGAKWWKCTPGAARRPKVTLRSSRAAEFHGAALRQAGAQIEDGDIVVLDVARSMPVTRGHYAHPSRERQFTPPSAKFSIVLGAPKCGARHAQAGEHLCKKGDNSAYKVSYDYINSHGKDLHGKPLGQLHSWTGSPYRPGCS